MSMPMPRGPSCPTCGRSTAAFVPVAADGLPVCGASCLGCALSGSCPRASLAGTAVRLIPCGHAFARLILDESGLHA